MSDVEKLKKCRAYVKGTINSKLKQLKDMLEPEAAASAPSETLVFSLITDVEEKILDLEEFTEAICLEVDDELMLEEVENNSKFVSSVKTQTCMYRDSFLNKVCSQNNSVHVENSKTIKLPLPPITLESLENNSLFHFQEDIFECFSWHSQFN